PIIIILDGSNYPRWPVTMKSFLEGRKLWRTIIGDRTAPKRASPETIVAFADRLEEWDNTSPHILTWFTSSPIGSGQSIADFHSHMSYIWSLLSFSESKWHCRMIVIYLVLIEIDYI
ncbi:DUF4219 domain-containing protein, partial [Cephalotus follicularis]